MAPFIYHNGIFVDEKEAVVPVTDRAYLYGEGLFETMKAFQGRVPFLPEHLDRFFQSLPLLDFQLPLSREELEHAVYRTLRQNHLRDAYLRMQLSRENEGFGNLRASGRYHLVIVAQELNSETEKLRAGGMAAVLFPDWVVRPHPFSMVKATHYAVNLRAKAFARQCEVHEVLLADARGQLVEGASSNLFVFTGDTWVTPPLNQGALPGVMRRVLLGLMMAEGIPFEEGSITPQALARAPEAILTNAIWEIMPLTLWEKRPIGGGRAGEETLRLQGLLREEIRRRSQKKGEPNGSP